MCLLPTDGGGNADMNDVLILVNKMRLTKKYAKEFPDDPPITSMDIIYWIRIAKRMDVRLCWMMPVASAETPPFWEPSARSEVKGQRSTNSGLL